MMNKNKSTLKSQWCNSYQIYFFSYGGTLFEAVKYETISDSITNEFETEQEAWDCLDQLNGLNPLLQFTVLKVRVFVGDKYN
jgi:hypothetical protein